MLLWVQSVVEQKASVARHLVVALGWALALAWVILAAGSAQADTLSWNTRPATNLRTGGVDNLTYGTAPAQITVSTSGAISGVFDGAGPNILAIEPASTSNGTTGFIRTTMNASVDNESVFQTTTISFTEPVYNVSVIVGDIDGGPTFSLSGAAFNDIIEFRAVNVAGATILPTSGTPASAAVTWNAGTGRALSTNTNITDLTGNVTVTFAGPIRSFTIRHIAGANSTTANPTQQFVFIETVTYTRSPLLTVQKTSMGGTGTFTFTRSNVLNTGTTPWSATTNTANITTAVAGTPVSGSPAILFASATDTTITESGVPTWQISTTPANCADSNNGVSGNPATFTAAVSGYVATVAAANVRAGANITCTIVNSVKPVLTLVKTVTNDNGGSSAASAWTLTATGPDTISGASGTAAVTSASVNAGTYALSETGPSGYTAGAWSCTAGSLSGSNLTLALGQTATCTINNNDIAATLTLVKVIDGDVMPSDVPNFTLTATGPTTISGITGAAAVTNASVSAGNYTLSESGPSGYVLDTASCTAGTLSGLSLTLPLATTSTCTIRNYRVPTFAVQKITMGGFGGPFSFADTGVTGSFSDITATSAGVATPASPTPLPATFATPVTITESMGLAWISGGVSCSDANAAITGNTNPVATSATDSVAIPAAANRKGAIITCVFTNAAAAPSLAMSKTPSVPSVNAAGQTVTYSIQVGNTGNTTLGPITVSDALGSVTCPSSGGTTVTSLAAGGNETCSFSYVVPQAVLDNNGGGDGDIDNTASSSTTYNGSPVNGSASAAVTLVITPNLVIDKQASTAGPVNANDNYSYTFRVRNTGNVTVTGVVVNDTFNGYGAPPVPGSETMFADAAPLGDSSDGGANGSWDSLAPGDEIQFTASYTVVQGDIDNP